MREKSMAIVSLVLLTVLLWLPLETVRAQTPDVQQWERIYGGTSVFGDKAYAIAVDHCGNVYVTGFSCPPDGYLDCATVKYTSDGELCWDETYSTSNFSFDVTTAIALDCTGNVYVTGWTYDQSATSTTLADYLTIKYDGDGNFKWAMTYDAGLWDQANGIAVDGLGNVYVTGCNCNDFFGGPCSSSPPPSSATIKYDGDGNLEWEQPDVALCADAIATDGSGNVYITGSDCNDLFITIKRLAFNGDKEWAKIDDGGDCWGHDWASAIAVDCGGDIYVTQVTDDCHYMTVKYDSAGNKKWATPYTGPGNYKDKPSAIATDCRGYVYITGSSYGSGTEFDYATVKYSSHDGATQWVARYSGPSNSDDRASAIAADCCGNVYVTGESYGIGTDIDYATVKYDSAGVEQWVARYDRAGSIEHASAIAADCWGNVYVTGSSSNPGTSYEDYTTIKYSTIPPIVTTNDASSIVKSGATLNGTLYSKGTAPEVKVSFQWGTTPGVYPNETQPKSMDTTNNFLHNLRFAWINAFGGTYYFRAKADGGTHGTSYGAEKSFTTRGWVWPPPWHDIMK